MTLNQMRTLAWVALILPIVAVARSREPEARLAKSGSRGHLADGPVTATQ